MRAAILTVALLLSATATAQRAPYLQRLTPTEVTIVWRDGNAAGEVCYGTAPNALTERVVASTSGSQHEARLTGLNVLTEYFYAATDGSGCPAAAAATDHFTTAPEVGSDTAFRVWVVGDSGTGGSRQAEVRDAMLGWVGAQPPDIYLHVGDMAYADGTTNEFTDNFFGMYSDILRSTNCWPAMGNHEGRTADSGTESGPYYDAYVLPRDGVAGGMPSGTEAYYSFDHANVHFVVLDSHDSPRSVDGAMLQWLDADLAAADATWIVAFWHHPPYTKGSHDSDNESQLVQMRENALPILESYGADLIFGGHSHIYERSFLARGAFDTPTTAAGYLVDTGDGRIDGDGPYDANDGTVYVVAGHGGAGVSGSADHPLMYFSELDQGSVIFDVSGPTITLRNIRRDGEVTDELTLVKGVEDTLLLVSPLGGETLAAGAPLPVRWLAPDDTANVRVELSLDGGDHWGELEASTPNDGELLVTAPEVRTDEARVRVTDTADATRTDESGNFSLVGTRTFEPIAFGGRWEYHDGPTAPAADWNTTTGGWPEGNAELGYGDGDEVTELLDADPNVPTVYFRQSIALDGEVTRAELDVLYDDAIAVFVNGSQVLGIHVDDGLDHDTFSSGSDGDDARASRTIDGSVFTTGENVIAALVKQASGSSSDLSFDLRLTLVVERDLPGPDAGIGGDGGTAPRPDGSTRFDGSTDTDGDGGDDGGCGCTTLAARELPGALLLFGLLVLALRRRR